MFVPLQTRRHHYLNVPTVSRYFDTNIEKTKQFPNNDALAAGLVNPNLSVSFEQRITVSVSFER